MTKTEIITKANTFFCKVGFELKKRSPEILAGAGTVGVVTSTVMACKATLEINDILDKTKERIDALHEIMESPELQEETGITEEKSTMTAIYFDAGVKMAKLYAPSVILGAASLACLLQSNNILRKRGLAVAAALSTVTQDFNGYRSRVVSRFGADVDRELKHNVLGYTEVEKTIVNDKGKEKKVKVEEPVISPEQTGYSRIFDELNTEYYDTNAYANRAFLVSRQCWANDRLKATGYLFLNDVLTELGYEPTKSGQVAGWVNSPDTVVDFGIFDCYVGAKEAFLNDPEPAVLLDFNCEPYILDKVLLEL